jgi:hypothetical protein
MKFKGKLKLGTVDVPKTDVTPAMIIDKVEVEYECEYTLEEVTGSFELAKQIVRELPEIIEGLKGYVATLTEDTPEMEQE